MPKLLHHNIKYFTANDISFETFENMLHGGVTMADNKYPLRGATDIPGLMIDFNSGLRLQVPCGEWHVCIFDGDTGKKLFEEILSDVLLVSAEKYFIRWQIDIYQDEKKVFSHSFDPAGQHVHFFFNGVLGDSLAALPYLGAWERRYGGRISCSLPKFLRDFARRCYPGLEILEALPEDAYASFYFNAGFFKRKENIYMFLDGREYGLWQTGAVILGLNRPEFHLCWQPYERTIKEPYVCIGVQASGLAKGWHYPGGWDEIVRALKARGYRVLCIDKERKQSYLSFTSECPAEAEDYTGDIPIVERAEMLSHAEFFIGLSSGLAWLARSVQCPVILIGGFSRFWYEFPEAYRVYSYLTCNGCFNDSSVDYYNNQCPRWSDEENVLQCSRKITPRMVWNAIETLLADKAAGRLKR